MPYSLQLLRALMEAHPERAEPLRRHVEALEASIQSQPAFCLQNVRTLFEAAHATIAPYLGVTIKKGAGFPDRMGAIIEALDFSIDNHPDAAHIGHIIADLLKAIDDTTVALAKLSNIPNMRHGGSLDWGTLEKQHAVMLGNLCDTLVSFLFDIAWKRPVERESKAIDYTDFRGFNAWLDDEFDEVAIVGSKFLPSLILYTLDETQYEAARLEWHAEQAAMRAGEETAA